MPDDHSSQPSIPVVLPPNGGSGENGENGETPPPVAEGRTRWTEATKEVRKTAQWLATGAGAAAAVIFGGGPILARVDLDPTTWSAGRIGLTFGSAVIGVVGVLLVIAGLVKVQLPIELTLSTLPDEFKKLVNEAHEDYLPAESRDLEAFRRRLLSYRRAAAMLPSKIAKETDTDQKLRLEQTYLPIKHNADLYTDKRSELLAQAGYYSSTRLFETSAVPIVAGAVLAVIGATGYLLSISGSKAEKTDSSATGTEIATLVAFDDGRSRSLIRTVGIDACAPANEPGRIPVLVHGGMGTTDDPWQLESLGFPDGCPAVTFTAIGDVVQVVKQVATPHTITYKPTSSTTSSTTTTVG